MPFSPYAAQTPEIWLPSDAGLLDAASDPALMNATASLVAGTLYLMRTVAKAQYVLAKNSWFVATSGVGGSTGSFTGVYDVNGNLLSGSADIGAQLVAANQQDMTLSTPVPIAAGQITYRALLANLATTMPIMAVMDNNNTIRVNFGPNTSPSALLRASINGTGLVALPGSIVPANNAQAAALPLFWGAK